MSNKFEQFGKYILLEKIAAGGMAEIYLARSNAANGLNKFFAVKRILPQFSQNEDFVAMFKEEAKVAINLNHSNVVSIFDFGIEASQFYLVMEFCEGRNLRQIINELKKANKSFSIDQAVYMVKEAAAGLDHAHRCTDSATGRPLNITHRDMSPQNIMISFEGEVKVIDFGIAKAETEAEATKAGTIKGKFSYMSPEQAEGQPIDPRTDVFALGIVLWELLANDRLFSGSNEAAILRKVRECQVPPIRKINPTVPPELEKIVMKALAKDKNVRYQTANNFYRDLNRFLNTQYPDYSVQDFSLFIKENFKAAVQEGREKLVAYANADMNLLKSESVSLPKLASPTVRTQNNVASKPAIEPAVPKGFNQDTNYKVKLDDLKIASSSSQSLATPPTSIIRSNTNIHNTTSFSNTGIHKTALYSDTQTSSKKLKTPPKTESSDVFLKAALAITLAIGGWWGYQNYFVKKTNTPVAFSKRNLPPTKLNETVSSSTATVKISVSSSPSGAQVVVNGQDTGQVTPAVISVTANKESEITIKKNGYFDYKINKTFAETAQVIATLQTSIAAAYLNINVKDADKFTTISINGKTLLEKPPILKYPISAGQEVRITAFNPITKATDETKITVEAGETKDINLNLHKK